MPRAQNPRLPLALALTVAALTGCAEETLAPAEQPQRWVAASPVGPAPQAISQSRTQLYLANGEGLAASTNAGATFTPLPAVGLPAGHVTSLLALDGEPDVLVAFVWGRGLYRSADGGASFAALDDLPAYELLRPFVTRRAAVTPYNAHADPTDPRRAVMAGPGGLVRSTDAGATWELITVNAQPGRFYLFPFDAAVQGPTIAAAMQAPSTLLPPGVGGLVGGGIVVSRDDGLTWEDLTGDLPTRTATGVALVGDALFASTFDGGLYRSAGDGVWEALGGPSDAAALTASRQGVSVASASRGAWRWEPDGGWSQVGEGAVVGMTGAHAIGFDGALYALEPGRGEAPPAPPQGTVHLALSFHVNLYHSYRGDTPDDDGYGLDIDVIRGTLGWLADYPEVHADWDLENHFSVDGWLASDAPDILTAIRGRVEAGQDDVRLMAWNNGAVSAQTFGELEQSVERAKASNLAAFGAFVPGVQPQENMFAPDHVGAYRAMGIEWITLFNSQSPFTGFPLDLSLTGEARYNPLTLVEGDERIVMVPVYNHSDVYDRGDLYAWVHQIAASVDGDSLLVIHFDADAETWLNFAGELERLSALDFVRYTTIQDYLDTHEPVAEVGLPGDLADGIGDGYQSWAEKDINHEVYTQVARARARADAARALAPDEAAVLSQLDVAMEPRLLALSTTNYGLASPFLHPDRAVSARAYAQTAVDEAQHALELAEAAHPVPAGVIELVNPRPASGPALVEVPLAVPASVWTGPEGVRIAHDGAELVVDVGVLDEGEETVSVRATVVAEVGASGVTELTWRYEPLAPPAVLGSIGVEDLRVDSTSLAAPFTECLGQRAEGALVDGGEAKLDPRRLRVSRTERYDLSLCDGAGTVARRLTRYEGLAGLVVAVDATMGQPTEPLDAESVALTPLGCTGDVGVLTWRTYGGALHTRAARRGQESWNGQAADGWVAYLCDDDTWVQVAHRVDERTSMAFSPMRNVDGHAVIAPLGTLWGDTPWHFGRGAGGLGVGDVVAIITPQFNPAAPDWAGKVVRYRLLLGAALSFEALDLFAHPPLVRVGAYAAPS